VILSVGLGLSLRLGLDLDLRLCLSQSHSISLDYKSQEKIFQLVKKVLIFKKISEFWFRSRLRHKSLTVETFYA
jgi:hypothetical protein